MVNKFLVDCLIDGYDPMTIHVPDEDKPAIIQQMQETMHKCRSANDELYAHLSKAKELLAHHANTINTEKFNSEYLTALENVQTSLARFLQFY